MRKIFFSLSLFLLSSSLFTLFAQPCGEKLDCPPGIKYPYTFCKDGKKIQECTDDPYKFEEANAPYTYAMKAKLPIYPQFEDGHSNMYTSGMQNMLKYRIEEGREIVLFGEDIIAGSSLDFISACEKWNCVCGIKTDIVEAYNNGTVIKTIITDDDKIFRKYLQNPYIRPAFANMPYGVTYDSETDKYDCQINYNSEEAIIYFNATPQFLYGIEEFVPNYSNTPIINGWVGQKYKDNANSKLIPRNVPMYNYLEVAMHEIGHMLGFDHYDNEAGMVCDNKLEGVMNSSPIDIRDKKETELSNDDKCMFAKLYCPELSGVGIYEIPPNPNIIISPNPINDEISISFEISDGVKNVSIQIYSEEGKILGTLMSEKMYSEGIHIYNTKLNLQSGAYFILTKIENINHFNKIIIE